MGRLGRPSPFVRYVFLYPASVLALVYAGSVLLSFRFGNLVLGLTLAVGVLWGGKLMFGSRGMTPDAEDWWVPVRSHTQTERANDGKHPVGRSAGILLTLTIATIIGWVILLGIMFM